MNTPGKYVSLQYKISFTLFLGDLLTAPWRLLPPGGNSFSRSSTDRQGTPPQNNKEITKRDPPQGGESPGIKSYKIDILYNSPQSLSWRRNPTGKKDGYFFGNNL